MRMDFVAEALVEAEMTFLWVWVVVVTVVLA